MRYLLVVVAGLLIVPYSRAETAQPQPQYDSVTIGFIPAKYRFHQGEPPVVLEARTLAHHKNHEIEKFHQELKRLASEGRTDNATEFHQPTIYIDAVYQGDRVRLFFSGDTRLEKFRHYEKQWKRIHGEVYRFLNARVTPDLALSKLPRAGVDENRKSGSINNLR